MKIRRLGRSVRTSKIDASIFLILKGSLLGQFYIKYLRQFKAVRSCIQWAWHRLMPVLLKIYLRYLNLTPFKKSIPFKLQLIAISTIKLSHLAKNFIDRTVIYPKQTLKVNQANIFSGNSRYYFKGVDEFYFPEIYIAAAQRLIVVGASNFLYSNKNIIWHDLFKPKFDYTSEELHAKLIIDITRNVVNSFIDLRYEHEIESGVIFTDATSNNYAHFLTEVLTKVFIYCKEYPDASSTFIIDYGLHENLLQAFELVVGEKADVVGLEISQPVMVKSLQVVSVCGYVPFDKRPGCEKPLEVPHGLFSPFVLQSMRNFILCKALSLRQYNSPLKVFIRRNSNYRMLINATEVEAFLLGCGFVIVEPENLSFIEQVELFHNAGIIIGASGAALANLIFCKPEAKIIILTSDYKDMIFGYWQNMAAAVENNVTFVKGKSTDKFTSLHSDFSIAIPDLINAISY